MQNNPQDERDLISRLLLQWAELVLRHRLAMLMLPIVLAVLCIPTALRVQDQLSPGGWLPSSAESVQVDHQLDEEFGRHTTAHYLLFTDPTGTLQVTDTAFQREMARNLAPLRQEEIVTAIYAPIASSNPQISELLVSADGTRAMAMVQVEQDINEAAADLPRLLSLMPTDSHLTVSAGGWPATTAEFQDLTTSDLARAERISLPITLVVLVIIFGGVLAAGLPLLATVVALVPTLALMWGLSHLVETSIFTVNIVIMIGLALGIDYALILISRYREERASLDVDAAMRATIVSAGRTVLVSGAAVATGLSGLLTFGVPAATSTALVTGAMVAMGVLLSLSLLPAALLMLGDRVTSHRKITIPWHARVSRKLGGWAQRARSALDRHPVSALIVSVALLLALAIPVLQATLAMPSMTIIPASQPARQMYEDVLESFPSAPISPITVIVEPRRGGDMTSNRNLNRLTDFIANVEDLDHVDGVTSVESFLPNGVGLGVISSGMRLEPELATLVRPFLTKSAAVIEVHVAADATPEQVESVVRTLRAEYLPLSDGDLTVMVGGESATGIDLMDHLSDRLPWTLTVVFGLTAVVLFLQFRSVFLPIKALLLNSLSLAASFGVLVWVFQNGHLQGVLGYEPLGHIVVIVPLLMFCFMFGLSMDYEVIMLSRIRESWLEAGDNRVAVSEGMRGSARIVTSAALIMVVVFAAFGTSEVQVIQQIGFGLALAVILDATLIRLVALPAAMQVMGRWNWWAPHWPHRSSTSGQPMENAP